MANSWWEQNNENALAYNAGNRGVNYMFGGTPPLHPLMEGPSDWNEFRKNYGGGHATEGDYKNWQIGRQRERTLSDFVNNMATQDSGINQFTNQMRGDYGQFKGRLDSYLDTPAPVASQSNRFETGLGDAESRLRALLDDPDSIRKSAAYKFRVGQGEEALQRQLGAKGLLRSGNRLMELTKYGQDMGAQEYDAQAGRISDLLGKYSQSWLGDKNANTQRYAAEANAWNQRGGLLSDILGKSREGLASASKLGSDQRLGWADLWSKVTNKPEQWATNGVRSVKWGT